jgi:hypothetical protein
MSADGDSLELAFYGLLNKTRFGPFPKKVVKVSSESDFKEEGVPRFENFRGAPGGGRLRPQGLQGDSFLGRYYHHREGRNDLGGSGLPIP